MYVPHRKTKTGANDAGGSNGGRSRGMTSTIRREVLAIDKDLPIYNIQTMDDVVQSR